jgi:hypothetical protein
MGDPGVVIGCKREKIGSWNLVGIPNDLARLEVPPEIGVVESGTHREDRQHRKDGGQHHGKRKDRS